MFRRASDVRHRFRSWISIADLSPVAWVAAALAVSSCSLILDPPPLERDAEAGDLPDDGTPPEDAGREDVFPDVEDDGADTPDVLEDVGEVVDGSDDAEDAGTTDDADATETSDDGGLCGNGLIDPGEDCEPPATRACTTACGTEGEQLCSVACLWPACMPPAETCNGIDDDCDGVTDPGCDVLGASCSSTSDCAGVAGLVCNTSWGICVVADCAGRGDFTPCIVVSTPDRSYDICVSGTCVSPGCGSAGCNTPGPSWSLGDTGQRSCFDDDSSIPCPGTPGTAGCGTTPFCGQDAQYGWDVTHGADERFVGSGGAEPIATDQVTRLVWQACPRGQSGASCATGASVTSTWGEALAYCDGLTWGGFADWRLPDRWELQSIAHYGRSSSPAVDVNVFPATPLGVFWTSTAAAHDPPLAWTVGSQYEAVAWAAKTAANHVRCVRSAPVNRAPTEVRLERATTGTGEMVVTDRVTGLIWQGCAVGRSGSSCEIGASTSHNWAAALQVCEDLNWGGWDLWTLPTAVELASLIDPTIVWMALDPALFPRLDREILWSSTTHQTSATVANAWIINLEHGSVESYGKGGGYGVRCVLRP